MYWDQESKLSQTQTQNEPERRAHTQLYMKRPASIDFEASQSKKYKSQTVWVNREVVKLPINISVKKSQLFINSINCDCCLAEYTNYNKLYQNHYLFYLKSLHFLVSSDYCNFYQSTLILPVKTLVADYDWYHQTFWFGFFGNLSSLFSHSKSNFPFCWELFVRVTVNFWKRKKCCEGPVCNRPE